MITELKSCPFCGGEAELQHDHSGGGYSYIRCVKCGVRSIMFMKEFDRSSDADAVNYWNGRAEDGK